jgi:hypothetical protein
MESVQPFTRTHHISRIAALAITTLLLAMGPVTETFAQTATNLKCKNCVEGKEVKNSSLTGSDIKNSSLTGKDIKNSSLTGSDVKNESLTGADIGDGSLTGADIGDGSLTGDDISDGSLTGADISDGSLTGDDITDGSIGASDLGNEAVTTSKIGQGAVDTFAIEDNAVTAAKLGLARTHFVEHSGDGVESCATLRSVLADVTDPLDSRVTVVLGPGRYECGTSAVIVRGLRLVGFGPGQTEIVGKVQMIGQSVALESLSVILNVAESQTEALVIGFSTATGSATTLGWTVQDVDISVRNGTTFTIGLRAVGGCGDGRIRDVDVDVDSNQGKTRGVSIECPGGLIGINNLRSEARPGGTNLQDIGLGNFAGASLRVTASSLSVTGTNDLSFFGTSDDRIVATELDGPTSGGVCIGSYNENGFLLPAGC